MDAFAQDDSSTSGSDPWAGIEEMLVIGSGEGALGLLSETGSVTSFGSEDLAAYGIENTTDLAAFTPNLEIVQNSATTATFFIRGVGLQDFSANSSGAVAIYLDGMPLNMPTLQVAPIFDAQSVEVLKGPQGSGGYRNASAGMIAISSRKPDLSATAFNFQTSQGSVYSVDAIDAYTRSYDAGFSVPIIPDVLATRFAFRSSDRDPIFTNRCGLRPDEPGVSVCREGNGSRFGVPRQLQPGLNKKVGNRSVYSFRSSWLLAPPTDTDLEFLGTFFFSRRDQDGNFGQAIGTGLGGVVLGANTAASNGNTDTGATSYSEPDASNERVDFANAGYPESGPGSASEAFTDNFTRTRPLDKHPFDGDFNKNGTQRVEVMGGTLNASADFDAASLSITGGVARVESTAINDTDLVPNVLFEVNAASRMSQASVDLALEGELEEWAVSWEVGGYFFWQDLEVRTFTDLATTAFDSVRFISEDIFSSGVYASVDIDLFEDFTLSAGGRFNNERKQFDISNIRTGLTLPPANASDELTWREPTGTVKLLYRFSESTSAYIKFNHGFKPGHFNSNGVNGRTGALRVRDPAKPEVIDAFEFGLNGSYFDDRINFSGALFHYNYEDYQVFVFEDNPSGGPALEVINANDAQVVGAEVEFRITPLEGFVPEPIEGLELNLRGGWLDSIFLNFQSESNVLVGTDIVQIISDYTGNPLLNSPRFTVSGGLKWAFLLGRLGEIEPRYDFSWTDDVFYDPSRGVGKTRLDGAQLPAFTLGQRSYVLHNVRLTYRPPESPVTFSGWCRNVTDERYKSYAFDVSSFRGVVVNYVGDPRICGADLSFSF